VSAGSLAKAAEERGGRPRLFTGETSASVTTADLQALTEHGDEKISHEQFRTWVVAQAVRNALQTFHGCWGLDPDNPRPAGKDSSATGRCGR